MAGMYNTSPLSPLGNHKKLISTQIFEENMRSYKHWSPFFVPSFQKTYSCLFVYVLINIRCINPKIRRFKEFEALEIERELEYGYLLEREKNNKEKREWLRKTENPRSWSVMMWVITELNFRWREVGLYDWTQIDERNTDERERGRKEVQEMAEKRVDLPLASPVRFWTYFSWSKRPTLIPQYHPSKRTEYQKPSVSSMHYTNNHVCIEREKETI